MKHLLCGFALFSLLTLQAQQIPRGTQNPRSTVSSDQEQTQEQQTTLYEAPQTTASDVQQTQTPPQTTPPDAQQAAPTTPAGTQQPAQGDSNRSVIKVKPGGEVLKPRDLYDRTGYLHPFARMPKYVVADQGHLWTAPFHTAKKDIKWWAIVGTATAALIATDRYTEKNLPNTKTQVTLGTDTSYLGAAYTVIPIGAGFYFIGTHIHNDRFREAGLLSFETMVDTFLLQTVIKTIADRARPDEVNGNGGFFSSPNNRIFSGFPSGHAMNTFALAALFAREYHDKMWVKILCYSYAALVSGARMAARKHFPGDVVAGGAAGWFIGDYVYAKRHNPEIDEKPSAFHRVLDHVSIGGDFNPARGPY